MTSGRRTSDTASDRLFATPSLRLLIPTIIFKLPVVPDTRRGRQCLSTAKYNSDCQRWVTRGAFGHRCGWRTQGHIHFAGPVRALGYHYRGSFPNHGLRGRIVNGIVCTSVRNLIGVPAFDGFFPCHSRTSKANT